MCGFPARSRYRQTPVHAACLLHFSGFKRGVLDDISDPPTRIHCRPWCRPRGWIARQSGNRSGRRAGRHSGRRPEVDPLHRTLFLRSVRAGGLQDRGAAVRNADRVQERGRDQVGRFRRVRHCRSAAGRCGRRTGRGHCLDLQPRHGDHCKEGCRDYLDQGPQGQAGRGVSGNDAGSVLPGAAAHGRHDDQGCRAGPRFLQRNAYRICPAATSMRMSAPNPAPACRYRAASARWSNIHIRRRWGR